MGSQTREEEDHSMSYSVEEWKRGW